VTIPAGLHLTPSDNPFDTIGLDLEQHNEPNPFDSLGKPTPAPADALGSIRSRTPHIAQSTSETAPLPQAHVLPPVVTTASNEPGPFAAENAQAFVQQPTTGLPSTKLERATRTPVDASVTPATAPARAVDHVDPVLGAIAQIGAAPFENPGGFIAGNVAAIPEAIAKLGAPSPRGTAEQFRFGTDEPLPTGDVAPVGGKEKAIAAAQLVSSLLAPEIGGSVSRAAEPFIGAGPAALAGGVAAGVAPGAAFMPEHPIIGALGGGLLGGVHAVAGYEPRARAQSQPANLADHPDRLLGHRAEPPRASVKLDVSPEAPGGSPFDVEMNSVDEALGRTPKPQQMTAEELQQRRKIEEELAAKSQQAPPIDLSPPPRVGRDPYERPGVADMEIGPKNAPKPSILEQLKQAAAAADAVAGEANPFDAIVKKPKEQAAAPAQPSVTGLDGMGASMGAGAVDGMYDALWKKVNAGDVTEGGQPSALLQVAKRVRDAGGVQSIDDLKAIAKDVTEARGTGAVGGRGAYQRALQAVVAKHSPAPTEEAAAPETKHEYSSTQVNLPPATAQAIQQLGARIPDEHLAEDGRETEPHITVKYGLHGDNVEGVRRALADEPPITATLGKTSLFQNDDADVLKADVESPDLHRLNKKIADAVPHTDTHPDYVPHATIAYLKPGAGKQYAGDAALEGHRVTIDHVTFSDRNGQAVDIPLTGARKKPVTPQVSDDTKYVLPTMVTSQYAKPSISEQLHALTRQLAEQQGDVTVGDVRVEAEKAGIKLPTKKGELTKLVADAIKQAGLVKTGRYAPSKVAGNHGNPRAVYALPPKPVEGAAPEAQKPTSKGRLIDILRAGVQPEGPKGSGADVLTKGFGGVAFLNKNPSGTFSFNGGVHGLLAYVKKDGGTPDAQDLANARIAGPNAAGLKSRVFKSADEALAAAEQHGQKVGNADDFKTAPAKLGLVDSLKQAVNEAPKWTELGKNSEGDPVYVDHRGVRSVVRNGVRLTEPVGMRPARGSAPAISVSRDADGIPEGSEFRTVDEHARVGRREQIDDEIGESYEEAKARGAGLTSDEELDYAVDRGEMTEDEADRTRAFRRYSEWRKGFKPAVRGDDVPTFEEWLVDEYGHTDAKKMLGREPETRDEENARAQDLAERRLTPYDTPAILEARHHNATTPHTELTNAELDALADRFYGNGAPLQQKDAVFLVGLPASRKSTIVRQFQFDKTHLVTDADEYKKAVPGYEGGKGSFVVHPASSEIRNRVIDRALEHGDNFVLQTVAGSPELTVRDIERAKSMGYRVRVIATDLPAEKAAQGAVRRYEVDHEHFVDPDYILRLGKQMPAIFDRLSQIPGVRYERYDTDVAKGEAPRLVESRDNGTAAGEEPGRAVGGSGPRGGSGVEPSVREARGEGEKEEVAESPDRSAASGDRVSGPPAKRKGKRLEPTNGVEWHAQTSTDRAEIQRELDRHEEYLELGLSTPEETQAARHVVQFLRQRLAELDQFGTQPVASPDRTAQTSGQEARDESVRENVDGGARAERPDDLSDDEGGGNAPRRSDRRGPSGGAGVRGAAGEPHEVAPGAGDVRQAGAAHRGAVEPSEGGSPRGDVAEESRGSASGDGRLYGQPDPKHPDATVKGTDVRLSDADDIGAGGERTKSRANLDAIRLALDLDKADRPATREEQATLAKYVGWGGLKDAFDPRGDKFFTDIQKQLRELLTPEEYADAARSALNAHYTSPLVVREMWRAMQRMGFDGGRALEPGVGIGNFLGFMPDAFVGKVRFTGVERDRITAAITKHLYPQQQIIRSPFEAVPLENNGFDIAIGNPPFGDIPVFDKSYPKALTQRIHDYFFIKSLDKVRPGGLVAFVTSDGTMDKSSSTARRAIADKADLIAAVRLPNTAFKKNAGTQVTTDILFFQKRQPGAAAGGAAWTDVVAHQNQNGTFKINEYYAAHPEQMLGVMDHGGLYRADDQRLVPREGEALDRALAAAVDRLPANRYTARPVDTRTPKAKLGNVPVEGHVRDGGLAIVKGAIMRREGNEMVDAGVPKTRATRVEHLIKLRDAANAVRRLNVEGATDTELATAQKSLNRLYDSFVRVYGPINAEKRTEGKPDEDGNTRLTITLPNLSSFLMDPDAPIVQALEVYDYEAHQSDPKNYKPKKADIMSRRTIAPRQPLQSADSPTDGMLVSLNEHGRVDLDVIAQLTGQTVPEVREALRGLIFKDPQTGSYDTAEGYTSGDVKKKLAIAEAAAKADPAFKENVAALKKAIPADIPPSQIGVELGAPWVPPADIEQFTRDLLKTRRVTVKYNAYDSSWSVGDYDRRDASSPLATTDYGTARVDAFKLLEHALNRTHPVVYDKTETGSVKNLDQTLAAEEKAEKIKEQFAQWLWSDDDRAARLARDYNDRFNTIRLRQNDGQHLTMPGAATHIDGVEFQWQPHQKNFIARFVYDGRAAAFHVVGAGKTFASIGAIMEAKRLGFVQKPLLSVPNHMLGQWTREFLQLYPGANLLVATEKDFEKARRREFTARIASSNYDAIVMTHSAMEKIPVSVAAQEAYIQEELDELDEMLRDEAGGKGKEARNLVRDLEGAKSKLEVRLQELRAQGKKDDLLDFEELGVDHITVDEAHMFKNLRFNTRLKGISVRPSQRAVDLEMKLRHVHKVNPKHSAMLLTGTPISNSMAEMYVMQRYMQPELLAERGLSKFDAWANTFAMEKLAMEMSPSGDGFVTKSRFSKFVNLGELAQMFRSFADVQMAHPEPLKPGERASNFPAEPNLIRLERPPLLGNGKPEIMLVPKTPEMASFMEGLVERARELRSRGRRKPEKGEDNFLAVTNDGRLAALDLRLVDRSATDSADNKLSEAARQIAKIYKDTTPILGTQLVFSDIIRSTKTGVPGFNAYKDLVAKLEKNGVKRADIAIIHDYDSQAKKLELFMRVRSGKVRVLIGSTDKMGAGTNVQTRLVALHHLDVRWRPSDVEQREGRILRQGNLLYRTGKIKGVRILRYVNEGSLDAFMWGTVARKAGFIYQGMTADAQTRDIEDVDEQAMSYAEIAAAASGDPRIMERATLDAEVQKLQRLRRAHADELFRTKSQLKHLPIEIKNYQERLAALEADAKKVQDTTGDHFKIVVDGVTYTERKKAAAAIAKIIDGLKSGQERALGKFAGFDLGVRDVNASSLQSNWKHAISLTGDLLYESGLRSTEPESIMPTLEAIPRSIPGRIEKTQEELAHREKLTRELEERVNTPFAQEARLEKASARLRELNVALSAEEQAKAKQVQASAAESPEVPADEAARMAQRADPYGTSRPKPPRADVPPPTTLYGVADPVTAFIKMWQEASALRRARLGLEMPPGAGGTPKPRNADAPIGSSADFDENGIALPDAAGLEHERPKIRPLQIVRSVKALFNPETLGPEARGTAGTIRHMGALGFRELTIAQEALKDLGRMVGKLSRVDAIKVWNAAERGIDTGNPELDAGIKVLHDVTQHFTDRLIKLDRLKAEATAEHYVGRFWDRGGRSPIDFLRRAKAKRPFEGPKSFLKRRTWEYMTDGLRAIKEAQERIDAGNPMDGDEAIARMRPATYNFVDSQLAKIEEMQRVIGAELTLRTEKKAKRAKIVMNGQEPPVDADGDPWQPIGDEGDPAFTIFGPPSGVVGLPEGANLHLPEGDEDQARELEQKDVRVFGRRIMGRWYAPKNSWAIWRNHLAKGLRGNPIVDAYMAPAQASAQLMLSFSGFHATTIATEGIFSDLALATDHLANEDGAGATSVLEGAKKVALSPTALARLAHTGSRVMQEYRTPGTHPEIAKVLDAMMKGGFRGTAKSEFWTGERLAHLKKTWDDAIHAESKGRQLWGAARLPANALWAGIEQVAHPLMGKYVPLMKTGATYELAARELAKLPPNASMDDVRKVMTSVVKEMDYRFGQVIYENHFIHPVIKHLAQMIFLAPGWTFGTQALAARGIRDVATLPKRAYQRGKRYFGGQEVPEGTPEPLIGKSAAYWLGAVAGTMLINGILTYLYTKHQPQGKDYFAFRDGTTDIDGNPNRHTLPGYLMHDIYGYATHPATLLKNKLSPVLAFMERAVANRDYFGDMLYDPQASIPTKTKQLGAAAAKELATPLSAQNYLEDKQRGEHSVGDMARNAFGVTPAKREFQRTPAQNLMAEYLDRRGHDARTPDEVAAAHDRGDIYRQYREGERTRGDIIKLEVEGELSRNQATSMIRRARESGLVARFESLSLDEAEKVFDLGNDEERQLWYQPLLRKRGKDRRARARATGAR
jgi:N12 class adenine-specific DNA methylase/2'-5' RNA ligase